MYKNRTPYTLKVGMQISAVRMEQTMMMPQKKKKNLKIDLPYDNYSTSGYVSKGNEIAYQRYQHSCVHYSASHNRQDMEST